jgi:hypothetical protein
MTYHLQHWEYFIEMSCFVPDQMAKVLSDSLGIKNVSNVAYSRIANSAKCARTREGLETIMLLILQDYIGDNMTNHPLIFDKFLENIDEQILKLKLYWADDHVII